MTQKNTAQAPLILFFLSCLIYMAKPWESSLQAMDSAIHARVALEIAGTDLAPHLPAPDFNLDSGLPYFNDQPFPFLWLTGIFMRTFGPDAWSARFLASAFAVASVLLLYFYLRRHFSKLSAFLSAFLFMVNPLWLRFSARLQLEPPMIFFILASFFAWSNFIHDQKKLKWALLSGAFAGLAVAMKSPVGLLIFPSAFLGELLFNSGLRARVCKGLAISILAASIPIAVTWLLANHFSGTNLFADYLQRQVLGTAIGGRGAIQERDWFFGLKTLGRFCRIEIIVAIIAAFFWIRGRMKPKIFTEPVALIISGLFVLMLVISGIKFKFPHYFLPGFPLLASLSGHALCSILPNQDKAERGILRFLGTLTPILMVSLLIFPIQTVPEQFVALRKLTPFIQAYAGKNDRVLFIDHLQPYGSGGDYFCEMIFYTRKHFMSSNCINTETRINKDHPEWILTSFGDKDGTCIPKEVMAKYPARLRLGNQILLSKVSLGKENSDFDLTPLVNELSATSDGDPIIPKKSLYFRPAE